MCIIIFAILSYTDYSKNINYFLKYIQTEFYIIVVYKNIKS